MRGEIRKEGGFKEIYIDTAFIMKRVSGGREEHSSLEKEGSKLYKGCQPSKGWQP